MSLIAAGASQCPLLGIINVRVLTYPAERHQVSVLSPAQTISTLPRLRVVLARDEVVGRYQGINLVLSYVVAIVLWYGTIKSAVLGRVPEGMITLMWLGTGLVLFQLQKTWRALRSTPESARRRLKLVFGNMVLVLAGNIAADIALLVMLALGRIQLSPIDRLNTLVSVVAVAVVVTADSWYARSGRRQVLVTIDDLKFRATLATCVVALFTRIWPGMMFVFSGSLHVLAFTMPAGYLGISLLRCAMTGLEHNQAIVNYHQRPGTKTETAYRQLSWLMWTDIMNTLAAALLFASYCVDRWVL